MPVIFALGRAQCEAGFRQALLNVTAPCVLLLLGIVGHVYTITQRLLFTRGARQRGLIHIAIGGAVADRTAECRCVVLRRAAQRERHREQGDGFSGARRGSVPTAAADVVAIALPVILAITARLVVAGGLPRNRHVEAHRVTQRIGVAQLQLSIAFAAIAIVLSGARHVNRAKRFQTLVDRNLKTRALQVAGRLPGVAAAQGLTHSQHIAQVPVTGCGVTIASNR